MPRFVAERLSRSGLVIAHGAREVNAIRFPGAWEAPFGEYTFPRGPRLFVPERTGLTTTNSPKQKVGMRKVGKGAISEGRQGAPENNKRGCPGEHPRILM